MKQQRRQEEVEGVVVRYCRIQQLVFASASAVVAFAAAVEAALVVLIQTILLQRGLVVEGDSLMIQTIHLILG